MSDDESPQIDFTSSVAAQRYRTVDVHIEREPIQDSSKLDGALGMLYPRTSRKHRENLPVPEINDPVYTNEIVKPEDIPRKNWPTFESAVEEEPKLKGRYWHYHVEADCPLGIDVVDEERLTPPFGNIHDMRSYTRTRVPISMVGAGLIYFNAARYSIPRFKGFMSMMDIKNIKKDEYIMLTTESKDPLNDGYLTMYRFISAKAYAEYFKRKMDRDPSLEKMPKGSLFSVIDKCVNTECKKYGRGKKVVAPKRPLEEGEEEEEEEEEEEVEEGFEEEEEEELEEEEVEASNKAKEVLNQLMQAGGKGRTFGEWALGFGFITESEYHKVYRLWSRPVFHANQPLPPPKKEVLEW